MSTPKTRRSHGESKDLEKSSGKKLVQARLPFKILATPPTVTAVVPTIESVAKETKNATPKWKSNSDKADGDNNKTPRSTKRRSAKDAVNSAAKKKQKADVKNTSVSTVVELIDSSDEESSNVNDSVCKENLNEASKQKRTEVEVDHDVCKDDEELAESNEDEVQAVEKDQHKIVSTPASNKKTKATTSASKNSKATPQSGNKKTSKGRKSVGDAASDSNKVQIKLPIPTKKNKRRKTVLLAAETNQEAELSDDMEIISQELHPQKRPKLNDNEETITSQKDTNTLSIILIDEDEEICNESVKSVETMEKVEKMEASGEPDEMVKTPTRRKGGEKPVKTPIKSDETEMALNDKSDKPTSITKKQESDADETSESDMNKSKSQNGSNTATDVEDNADTETATETTKSVQQKKLLEEETDEKLLSPKVSSELSSQKLQKKSLTPKQQRLLEQRLKAREEKERKIQEERLQKQREKEDREQAKKRDREEKEEKRRKEREEREEQRRKEREEKEDQRRKEREEKERKRLAENEAKNEEKRNKEEERKRKEQEKEEERKRKEQEKEEAELKKKKAALAFTKFFSRPAQDAMGQSAKENDESLESIEMLAFRPFQIKGDMKLAPVVRKRLASSDRSVLEMTLEDDKESPLSALYLAQLKKGFVRPYKWVPPAASETPVSKPLEDNDDDVMIVEDELERISQAIVEEHNEPVERLRSKFFKFHLNRRPPYHGTWRKVSKVITARRPFAQDKHFFDYEVDSDDEWEEEEPGESLDGSDDDKEKESEDEDYEVDNEWFVPHGHLSDEELQNEDDLGECNDREAQQAKLKILQQEFAQEMKKKTEKIKPRLIGCIWVDENGNQPELCPKIIWETLNMRTILCAEPPIMEDTETTADKNGDGNVGNGHGGEKAHAENKLKPIHLTETMLKELVRLVHGNLHSKNFLINEFIAYIEANEESIKNGDKRGPLKSVVRDKIQEFAAWEIVSKNSTEEDNITKNSSNKKKGKKKLCWVVSDEILEKMDMKDLDLNNNWKYVLKPRRNANKETPNATLLNSDDSNENSEVGVEQNGNAALNSPSTTLTKSKETKQTPNIKKFAKVLTPAEKAQQLQKQAEQMKTPTTKTGTSSASATKTTPISKDSKSAKQTNTTPVVKKRVPLLMSVACGQTIPTPDKNARISQFLKSINEEKKKDHPSKNITSTNTTEPIEIMEID